MKTNISNGEVLKLNKNWQVIGVTTIRQAISDMAADAATGLYTADSQFTPLRWREWLNIPVKDGEDFIQTVKLKVLIPRIIIMTKFDKLIVKAPKLTMKNLRLRDKDTCILSGKKLKPNQMSMEHIVPRSKGGRDTWDNIGLCDRDLNSERGNMPYEKYGKHPKWTPFAPRGKKPEEVISNKNNYPEWEIFLKSKKN